MNAMSGHQAFAMRRCVPVAAGLFLLVMTCTTASAATAYKCTGPDGRTTFSDQPCPDHEQGAEVELRGQPLIGGPDGVPAPDAGPDEGAEGEKSQQAEESPPAEEVVEDVRAPRLRRLDALMNQLYSGINTAGEDCEKATARIEGWIKSHGKETRELFAAWDEVRFEKLNLKQKELDAMRKRLRGQVSKLKSVTLPKLNAKCWNDRALGAAFDRLQPYLPGS
jgi:hypothetical protein